MLKPLPASKWNFSTAAHLLNRAGFGGTIEEIEALQKIGLEAAVDQLVHYEKIPDPTPNPEWAKPDPDRIAKMQEMRNTPEPKRKEMQREIRQMELQQLMELRGWWLKRMATGPRPLQEKMTLFWHGHFATSVQKVKEPYYMWRQNETFRTLATGSWPELLTAVAKDPAMLVWLDQAQSRKEHPNENFAREVMELFALGEGHYTEQDVTEAARALTGWTLNRLKQTFEYRSRMHDGGVKTVLGKTGNLSGADVLEAIVAQPQAARFVTAKLWTFFVAENPPSEYVDALAETFRRSNQQFKPLLRATFLSEEFYAENVIRAQVKSPVQWLVGSVRMLQRELPPPMVSANFLRELSQELFAPPNVKGWDGGITWITTNNLLARYNYAAALVQGDNTLKLNSEKKFAKVMERRFNRARNRPTPVQLTKLLSPEDRADKTKLIAALEKRFLQGKLKPKQEQTLRAYLDSQGALDDDDILNTIRLLMSTPEYQLT